MELLSNPGNGGWELTLIDDKKIELSGSEKTPQTTEWN